MIKWIVVLALIWLAWRYLGPRPRGSVERPVADRREARAILGVPADATADDIRAAHRRLVTGVHPDRGGSAELTRRVNAARDLLLNQPR